MSVRTMQAIEIAIEGLLNRELKINLRKLLRQGKIPTFEHCHAQVADLQDTLGLHKHSAPTQAPQPDTQPKRQ